ncbi:hypothetical protein CDD81_2483 [Ophiocordyceps australis]|uniref:Carboxylic ester hydrolase n=1 Tax=Ophiocordyceps australis TaxID=1399860 RepID=A0A2C5XB00_9HYPO|nr:hypothetical protein CDD81_2483 [Ophiocordyceps australis]
MKPAAVGQLVVALAASSAAAPSPLPLASTAPSVSTSVSSLHSPPPANGPVVSLGYASYQAHYNKTSNLNIWKSIRYAAPPVGSLRWQAPQLPLKETSCRAIPAVQQPPRCPQSGAYGVPHAYGFNSGLGDEDCLYLNVFAAPQATRLPVLVWIHGGGHSVFGATYDPSSWINTNDNGFVVVEMQYRLGAFGYLASPHIKEKGRLNAGLLDQRFALEWVQRHIEKFGGDPSRVTVGGESSGAASAVYQAMAFGGQIGSPLFDNVLAASPYNPSLYSFDDNATTSIYDSFVDLAGCGANNVASRQHPSVFDCLVAADSETLQNASGTVTTTRGYFGSFAFTPVLDGDLLQQRPSEQLLQGRIAGKRLLVGTNANEGVPLTNPNVQSRDQYNDLISDMFPLLTEKDTQEMNSRYKVDEAGPVGGVRFDTLGDSGPTALTQSGMATGIQQAAFNLAAEATFDCPAQWLAEAYSTNGRHAWKYQYSVTPSFHGADLTAYFAASSRGPGAGFRHALQKMMGNFIIKGDPTISVLDATANATNATVPTRREGDERIDWPQYSQDAPVQMNLNTTGGYVSLVTITDKLSYYVRSGAGMVNSFRLTDGQAWEGGRGARCEYWRNVSSRALR